MVRTHTWSVSGLLFQEEKGGDGGEGGSRRDSGLPVSGLARFVFFQNPHLMSRTAADFLLSGCRYLRDTSS